VTVTNTEQCNFNIASLTGENSHAEHNCSLTLYKQVSIIGVVCPLEMEVNTSQFVNLPSPVFNYIKHRKRNHTLHHPLFN
jgi:hypothetical protein